MRRRPLVLALLGAAALPAPARAAETLAFEPCGGYGYSCARLPVPVDRSGGVPGAISLLVKRREAIGTRRGVMVVLAGGPGQSATAALAGEGARFLAPVLDRRDLIVLDQRGTGRSGLLRCPTLERAGVERPAEAAAACARRLGARRAFYTSRDAADDLEALRTSLGVDRLSLFGVSYGTRTAQAYALRYPSRVDRMVLDSVVEADGYHAFAPRTFRAVPRVLRAVCGRACRSFTRDPVADLRRVVARLPLRGRVMDFRGRTRRVRIDRHSLFAAVLAGDFVPPLRLELPPAAAAARRGDLAPLSRLVRRAASIQGGAARPRSASPALYAATSCEESRLPWTRTAHFTDRLRQARQAARRLPEGALRPFDRATALRSDLIELCRLWPAASAEPVPGPGPLPDVPTLLLEGEYDLRTPVEAARLAARQLPRSSLVVVPGAGHSVLSADTPGCAGRAFARFMAGRLLSAPCPRRRLERPSAPPPAALRAVTPVPGIPGHAGRTAAALRLTLADVSADSEASVVRRRGRIRGGGLRRGSYVLGPRFLRLRGVSLVTGVRVAGLLRRLGGPSQSGTLRITGRRAARGAVRVEGRRFVGTLGGRRVSGRLPTLEGSLLATAGMRRLPPLLPPGY